MNDLWIVLALLIVLIVSLDWHRDRWKDITTENQVSIARELGQAEGRLLNVRTEAYLEGYKRGHDDLLANLQAQQEQPQPALAVVRRADDDA